MRRFLISLTVLLFFVTGCSRGRNDSEKAAQTAYEGYYKAIEENERFAASSLYYHISAQMSNMPDGTHRYYVFLDDAQVAMYDVVMMAVENNITFDRSQKMMPSVGIFDTTEYSLIPYQSNSDAGFVKGLVLGGECEDREILLKILVEWKDRNHEKVTREFLSMKLTPDGFSWPEENITETPAPAEETAEPEESEENE
ncbi:MAG: hypothetical protein E7190_07895 [Erysipelotrichaceae bacterium]|nr:hypothetical protein [Erysipelotrichaceae bacterium]